ncbi:isoleucyl-tRNA synthetase [Thermodesulfitimonas autotrophica]|uniref:Isoleucine--tRNA ligase n=1 Tax=Thermodesulfitimonas autotrophica TaxID=1894989 RepID=A0A3N5B0K0_9THEO|nr:isoleucine--tRNA ligase [Thermodesulfitimonas autotrophica]RPF42988.1 isoleucyl-tRNA synthetase [Thermodesulfitimonas autotrophica]
MDWSKTLNLPQTDFPMRANLPRKEPEILKFWDEIGLYRLVQQKTAGRPKFILHDGPPYANGHIHLGHALNKVLKDIIIKYYSMSGYDAPYVPGWDTHGLPIEQQAIKALGINRHAVGPVAFRRHCKEYALKFVDIQREEFKRLGVRGDWAHPYLTLLPEYEARQIEVFGEMAKKGYIYKGLKPVYWCASCETALAEAEVEYAEVESPSIYVAFAVVDGKGFLPPGTAVVIWTTTPWTLPANVSVCLHPDFVYVVVRVDGERYVVARELLPAFLKVLGKTGVVEAEYKGQELEGVRLKHPFCERESLVVLDTYVTLEQGTGCVHNAPGHGEEDFVTCKRYGLPVLSPVDGRGYFTAEGGPFAGVFYREANPLIIEELKRRGALLSAGRVRHQYPHCWRCKKPVFYRATEQWFASIDGFREAALQAIREVKWIPAWGEERIYNMVAARGDWCISRQRLWGVPLPIFYCEGCGKPIINDATITHLKALFQQHGSDVWYSAPVEELLPPGLVCPACGGTVFKKENDTMDVWFDSGSSHWAVLRQPSPWPDQDWPADLYLEGSDQHRGWFNSSLSTAVAVTGKPPYRAVLTHGFVVDEQGRKMSKSLGNVVDPLKVIEQLGADILRLWVCSADYRGDLAASDNILKQIAEAYRKIRNTFRFLLGNLYDFDPQAPVAYNQLPEIDRYILHRLEQLKRRVLQAYREYEFHVVYHAIHSFCVLDLSAFYLNVLKDRLYCEHPDAPARRATQTVLYEILDTLLRLLTPVLAFTTEEIWRYVPVAGEKLPSVQLLDLPPLRDDYLDAALEGRWERLLAVREAVLEALERARQEKRIGDSLEARVELYAGDELREFLQKAVAELKMICIVSDLAVAPGGSPPDDGVVRGDFVVRVTRAPGVKCARCWMYSESVGASPEYPDICARCAAVVRALAVER